MKQRTAKGRESMSISKNNSDSLGGTSSRRLLRFKSLVVSWLRLVVSQSVIAVMLVTLANAQPEEENAPPDEETEQLPRLNEMSRPPSYKELMDAEPYDWIVLKEESYVIVCDALDPRPDTLTRRLEERKQLAGKRQRTREESARLEELRKLVIRLPGDPADYVLKPESVQEIIGYELLMLERADLLISEGDTTRAFDLVQRVEQLLPGWEQAVPRFRALLVKEAEARRSEGKPYAALALLNEIYDVAPEFPGVSDAIGAIYRQLIDPAIEQADFPRARWHIERMLERYRSHPVVAESRAKIRQIAERKLQDAVGLAEQGKLREATRLARLADRIWPLKGSLRTQLERIGTQYQTVRVAVESLDNSVPFPVLLSPMRRHRELVELPLFEPEKFNEITYYQSAFIEDWDPQDLGRAVTFKLRTSKPYWQPQPLLTASQVADSLAARLDPSSSDYDPRLDSFVAGYSVRSPARIEIRFSRVPLNLAALFRIPVTVQTSGDDPVADSNSQVGRFVFDNAEDNERRYVRRVPEPADLNLLQYHIAEIAEVKFDSRPEVVQAFNRGEVDVIASVRPWEVTPIRSSELGFVQKLAAPASHVIVFNPESSSVRNAQLRRALSLAVPREKILQEIILRDPTMQFGRVSGSSWPLSSYATNPLLELPATDLRLAFALRFAAEEKLRIPLRQQVISEARKSVLESGEEWDEPTWRRENAELLAETGSDTNLPKLRLLCEPDETMQKAAVQMVRFWDRIGIDVELLPPDATADEQESWDLMYRRSMMEEPLLDLWSVLLTDDTLDIGLLSNFPDWMRQDLTLLDYAGSFRTARDRLFRMQRNVAAQAFLIPLWEVDQFVAFRKNVSGYRDDRPVSVYDNASQWVVKP